MRNKRLKIIANAFKYATASIVIGTGFLCLSNYQSSKTNKLSSTNAGTVVDTKTVPFSEILTSYVSNKWNEYSPETFEKFKKEHLDIVWSNLAKIATLLTDGETISEGLKCFLSAREKLIPYRKRLQDSPMLQVLAKYSLFAEYLKA